MKTTYYEIFVVWCFIRIPLWHFLNFDINRLAPMNLTCTIAAGGIIL